MTRSEFLKLTLATAAWPLGAALFARPASAQGAADVAGRIVRLQGAAAAMQDAVPRPLKADDPVYRGDVISTGRGARLEIKMLDDAVITLGEKTVFVVIDYVAGGAAPSVAMRLIEGAVSAAAGRIAKAPGGTMRVETDVATVGIRGTTVWIGILKSDLEVALLTEGRVTVQNRAGKVELTRIGDGTLISGMDVAPTPPMDWGKDMLDHAKRTVAF